MVWGSVWVFIKSILYILEAVITLWRRVQFGLLFSIIYILEAVITLCTLIQIIVEQGCKQTGRYGAFVQLKIHKISMFVFKDNFLMIYLNVCHLSMGELKFPQTWPKQGS